MKDTMKEQPLFAPGQKVICVDSTNCNFIDGKNPLIEGSKYTIDDPDYWDDRIKDGFCCVTLKEFDEYVFNQTRFVPVDFSEYAEETFHQSLKGKPVNA